MPAALPRRPGLRRVPAALLSRSGEGCRTENLLGAGRALAARPRLLLLDEPLAALDQTTRARVRHTLRRHLAGFGGVCLIVTHDPVEAVSLADRVLVLEHGEIVEDGPPEELLGRRGGHYAGLHQAWRDSLA